MRVEIKREYTFVQGDVVTFREFEKVNNVPFFRGTGEYTWRNPFVDRTVSDNFVEASLERGEAFYAGNFNQEADYES